MNSLVIYDSVYGNTEKIARAIAEGLGSETKLVSANDLDPAKLVGLDILVIGSPVHGGRASEKLQVVFREIKRGTLQSVKVAAFDTRFEQSKQGTGLKLLMGVIGFAADKMLRQLVRKGGTQIAEPEGFIVTGREGPLKEGELERAKAWGQQIVTKLGNHK